MSTNASTIHRGSIHYGRAGLAALLGALVLAAAAFLALKAGPPVAGTAPNGASDAAVQQALIDVRAGERAPLGVASDAAVQQALIDVRAGARAPLGASVPTAEFWAEFRAAERDMR